MTTDLQNFIATGELPRSMAARSKILDAARHQILRAANPKSLPENRFQEINLAAIRGQSPLTPKQSN